MHQVEMISVDDVVPATHAYRKFTKLWSFEYAEKQLKKRVEDNPNEGFGLLRLLNAFCCNSWKIYRVASVSAGSTKFEATRTECFNTCSDFN